MRRSRLATVIVGVVLGACDPSGAQRQDAAVPPRDARIVSFDGWTIDAYRVVIPTSVPDVPRDHPRCEPDAVVECTCGGGSRGRQRCTDAGIWEFCAC